jgi:hypothetical protein
VEAVIWLEEGLKLQKDGRSLVLGRRSSNSSSRVAVVASSHEDAPIPSLTIDD